VFCLGAGMSSHGTAGWHGVPECQSSAGGAGDFEDARCCVLAQPNFRVVGEVANRCESLRAQTSQSKPKTEHGKLRRRPDDRHLLWSRGRRVAGPAVRGYEAGTGLVSLCQLAQICPKPSRSSKVWPLRRGLKKGNLARRRSRAAPTALPAQCIQDKRRILTGVNDPPQRRIRHSSARTE
jgi:hypothetical protein